jgi:drug/metabolite transporter (DMT)-like permease
MSADLRPYLWMLLGAFSFAWMGTLAHEARASHPWQTIAFIRSLVPLVLVGIWTWAAGVNFVFVRPPILWLRSLSGSMSLIGTFYALSILPPSEVWTLTNLFPLWIALLSWPMLGAFPRPQVWVSIVAAIAGVYLIFGAKLVTGEATILIGLAISLFTAVAMMGLNRLKGIDVRAVVVHFSAVSLAFSAAAYWIFPVAEAEIEPDHWDSLRLIGVGLAATLGQVCLTQAFTKGDPARVSVVGLTQIVFALVIGAVLFGESPDQGKLLGIPLVLGPTAWVMLTPNRPPIGDPEPIDG